jgi:hypothetical protein
MKRVKKCSKFRIANSTGICKSNIENRMTSRKRQWIMFFIRLILDQKIPMKI